MKCCPRYLQGMAMIACEFLHGTSTRKMISKLSSVRRSRRLPTTATVVAAILAVIASASPSASADPLNLLENCTFVPTDWADGDSFRIRTEAETNTPYDSMERTASNGT